MSQWQRRRCKPFNGISATTEVHATATATNMHATTATATTRATTAATKMCGVCGGDRQDQCKCRR
jgi:hypothetical protein